jgi:hypothetical protein
MGILSATGVDNGFTNWWDQHRNAITNFGVGLANGPTFSQGIGLGTQGLASGAQQDDAYATQQKAEAERTAAITATQKALAKYPDLQALAVPGADMGPIIAELFRRSAPGYGAAAQPDPFTLGPGQTRYAADGTEIASIPAEPEKPQAAPTGYRWAPDGKALEPIPHGPADPATAGKTTEATRRNQQLAKVLEPEVQSLLGPDGNSGTFDALTNGWSQAVDAMGPLGLVVGGGPAAEYQQAKNSLKTIIASYLYSVSGATANPGEVETQASVLTPKPNEPAASVAEKRRRIATMVQAVRDAATGMPINLSGPSASGSTGDPELDRALQQYGN